MSDAHHDIKAWLADHPRLTGAVFAVALLLFQAGVTLADDSVTYGP